MDWEPLFQQWEVERAASKQGGSSALEALETKARAFLKHRPVPDREWLLSALEGTTEEEGRRRYFLCIALRHADQIPPVLFDPLLRAAVYERDPSFNRFFIVPCLRWAGPRKVNEALLHYLEEGTNVEKAGAASAFYWSLMHHERVTHENIEDLVARKRDLFLREFVTNQDVEVKRRILPGLELKPELYSEDLRPLIPQAIQLARNHLSTVQNLIHL